MTHNTKNEEDIVSEWINKQLGDSPTAKDYYKLDKKLKDMTKAAIVSKENYTPAEYLSFELGATAYEYILENGGTTDEAFNYASEVCNKSIEYVNKLRYKPYTHSSNIVTSYDNHPKQKKMLRKGTMDKVSLKNSNTASQLIKRLSMFVKLNNLLEDQGDKLETEQARNTKQDLEIKQLQDILGIETLPNQQQAILLKEAGFSNKAIAECLGVTTRTVRNYLT